MKLSAVLQKLGMIACIGIIVACFMPWVTFNFQDITFTGFEVKKFPNGVNYGRPGYFIAAIAAIVLVLMFIPKVWAKRSNIFISGFLLAYIFAAYIRFTNSLFDNEIRVRHGLILVIVCGVLILLACLFPDLKVKDKKHPAA